MDVSTDRFAMRDIDVKLYNICSEGTVEEVLRLINQGANPSAPHWDLPLDPDLNVSLYTEDYYCVHEAALNPDVRVLNVLVEHGADPNQFDYWDRQPLAWAVGANSLEIVRRLVELGNDPCNYDGDGGTVLSDAALNPDIRVVEFLLEYGAKVDEAAIGQSELDRALKEGTPERIRFFVEHGSDLNYICRDLLMDAPVENIRSLLECGLNPNIKEDYGDERVVNHLDPVRRALFVEFGADPG